MKTTQKMKTNKSKTGVVAKMREIRDNLGIEIMDMTFEQEKEYIKNQLNILKLKRSKNLPTEIKPVI